jgi:hypothetical protein
VAVGDFRLYFNYRKWGLGLCQLLRITIWFGFIELGRYLAWEGLDRFWEGRWSGVEIVAFPLMTLRPLGWGTRERRRPHPPRILQTHISESRYGAPIVEEDRGQMWATRLNHHW